MVCGLFGVVLDLVELVAMFVKSLGEVMLYGGDGCSFDTAPIRDTVACSAVCGRPVIIPFDFKTDLEVVVEDLFDVGRCSAKPESFGGDFGGVVVMPGAPFA